MQAAGFSRSAQRTPPPRSATLLVGQAVTLLPRPFLGRLDPCLLTLLSLGVKNIRIGPTLPAFLSPAVLKMLSENYNLMPTTTADADLAAILG